MIYVILIIWIAAILVYLRSSALAIGNAKRAFAFETFLLGQQVSAFLSLAALVLSIIAKNNTAIVANIINLLYIFLFYLQPTPRITKILLKLFVATNIILLVVAVMYLVG
jgi:hypothetical protein